MAQSISTASTRRRLVTKRVTVTLAAAGIIAGLSAAFGTVDWYPPLSIYGFSVGTSTHYCSVELAEWRLVAGCQSEPEN